MTPAGIYIHIPFCKSRCSYCDFATGLYQTELAERYVQAVIVDLQTTRADELSRIVDTIYFGGGTPSMLSSDQIERILAVVHRRFQIDSKAEVTIEINPGSVTKTKLKEFRKLGINRASFGAQTFHDDELARLGRSHSAGDTLRTFEYLHAADFDNISFDLIAGLPGQAMIQWQENVERSLGLRPEHLSFYLLEVHANTPLAQHIERGIQPKPDEDLAAEMYKWMLERACDAGYEHYEISNLCLPGFESRHNTKYWQGNAYYGFGCSAHSFDGRTLRWSNERDVAAYVNAIENKQTPIVEQTQLSDNERRAEAVFLGMRLMKGVDTREYEQSFGVDLRVEHNEDLSRFYEAGLIEFDGDVLRLTRAGALMSNEVFAALA
ncbi:MAG TPA: radical SAM family heme chaperone HemW [Pyrinomonadaceae bacterium]|jgi:oxygen-independent coproporphyrinogen-3 oxidase|nr:radical SAM family heme chaperone HemW [Pyrinomonadaceae bacterium]